MTIYENKKQLAKHLGIDPRTIDTMIEDKKVIVVKVKKIDRYILVNDIFIYLSQ